MKRDWKKNPIGLDDDPGAYGGARNIVDGILELMRNEGPEAYDAFLRSEEFRTITKYDPRFPPELAHEDSDPKERS